MADPLHVLRLPAAAVDPDPAFAARLLARLERALTHPRGVLMSDTTTAGTTPSGAATSGAAAPPVRTGELGYAWLSVPDLDAAVTFYAAVLGWQVGPGSDPAGRQVQGRSPDLGLHGGDAHATLNCCYTVDDVDAAVSRVRAAGGRAGEPRQASYGMVADCTDDQGTVFALYQPAGAGAAAAAGTHGDLAYVTHEVVDSGRARAFYGAVLGWTFTPGSLPDGWQIEGAAAGLHGGHPLATTLPMWRVDDIAVAIEQVKAAGGTSSKVQTRDYGLEAECADDQGTRFYLGQL